LNYLDLFSGIGGFALGAHWAGMKFENHYFSEIEKYPIELYQERFPDSIQLGDITKINCDMLILDTVSRQYYNKPYLIQGDDMAGKLKKLRECDVEEAIKMYQGGYSLGDLGKRYSVSRQSMWDLLRRRIDLRSKLRFGEDNNFYRGGIFSDKKVHHITEKAILKGKLTPEPCEECGEYNFMKDGRVSVQAHHNDYNKPLTIKWLCQKCHHKWHKNNKPIKRKEDTAEVAGDWIITGGFP